MLQHQEQQYYCATGGGIAGHCIVANAGRDNNIGNINGVVGGGANNGGDAIGTNIVGNDNALIVNHIICNNASNTNAANGGVMC